jgi:hypothetical protein
MTRKEELLKVSTSLSEAALATLDIWVDHMPGLERHAFGCVGCGYDGKNQTFVFFQFETPTAVADVVIARVTGGVSEQFGIKVATDEFIIPDLGFGKDPRPDEFFCKIWHKRDPMEMTLHSGDDVMRLKRIDVPVVYGPVIFISMRPAFELILRQSNWSADENMLNFCSTTPRRSAPAPYAKTPPEKLAPPIDLDF